MKPNKEETKAPAQGTEEQAAATPTPADGAKLADGHEAFERTYAAQIRERIAAGLTPSQALEVQREQIRKDANVSPRKG